MIVVLLSASATAATTVILDDKPSANTCQMENGKLWTNIVGAICSNPQMTDM
jgi:hypothetical protein